MRILLPLSYIHMYTIHILYNTFSTRLLLSYNTLIYTHTIPYVIEPLSGIVKNTCAKSLQYECIQTITEALIYTKKDDGSDSKHASSSVLLCSTYLKEFIQDSDPNLKYLVCIV